MKHTIENFSETASSPLLPQDIITMDLFEAAFPLRIDLVYADAHHLENIFGRALYHERARLLLHRDMARCVLTAARLVGERHGWRLVLKDGLRPVETQAAMAETDIVRRNPHWLEEPRLLSPPGQGAHPRGMAIDVAAEDKNGMMIDMGTVFDTMSERSARGFTQLPQNVLTNRKRLEGAFADAAGKTGLTIVPLSSEWWDFRFSKEVYTRFAPVSDISLPANLKICSRPLPDSAQERGCLERLAKEIVSSL